MKSKFALNLLAACTLSLLPAVAYGHNGQGEESADNNKVRTVTGCLEQNGNEYQVRAEDGATWELKGNGVDLADHLGQTVRVTGTINHAKMHEAKEKGKEKTGNETAEHGHMTVTNLKMVGRSCSR